MRNFHQVKKELIKVLESINRTYDPAKIELLKKQGMDLMAQLVRGQGNQNCRRKNPPQTAPPDNPLH